MSRTSCRLCEASKEAYRLAGERTQRVGVPLPKQQLSGDELAAFLATDLFGRRCRKLAALFSTVEEARIRCCVCVVQ